MPGFVQHHLDISVVRRHQHAAAGTEHNFHQPGHAAVHILKRLHRRLNDAGMPHHVGVRQIADRQRIRHAVLFRPCGPRFEETIRHLKHAHLRLEIIGRHILRRIDKDAILKGEGLLTPAAEKVGHMGVLFGFGDAELMRARVSHDFTQRLHQVFLGKRHRHMQ